MATFSRRVGNANFAVADPRVSRNLSNIAKDRLRVNELIEQNEAQRRAGLEEQKGVQKTRLEDLTQLLAGEEQRKFTQAIPEIAETAQAQGFLETSGFGESLARQRTNLAGQTAFRLSEQALSDRDLEVAELGNISREATGTRTGGVQREFSQHDRLREELLARELALIGKPNDPKGPSSAEEFASVATGTGALLRGGAAAGATHLCTHLKNLGLITNKEIKAVHKRVFPVMKNHPVDWLMYNLLAPLFIKFNADYDWQVLKGQLCEEVLNCQTNEEAFQIYKAAVMKLFNTKGEVVYG